MALLHMQTDGIRSTNGTFQNLIGTLDQQRQLMSQAVTSLINVHWQGPSSLQFQGEAQTLLNRIQQLAQGGSDLTQRLEREVLEWEEVASHFGLAAAVANAGENGDSSTKDEGNQAGKRIPDQKNDSPYQPVYDGESPADGVTARPWQPLNAPLQSNADDRDPALYRDVINQFAVETNPRYAQNQGNTYCNIFAWDVTKAMGAEIPHWVDSHGNPAGISSNNRELDANGAVNWIATHGQKAGWQAVTAEDAQAFANAGQPVVATWHNPGGIGHIGVVAPGEYSPQQGPHLAQAGAKNFNEGYVTDGFGNRPVVYYVHP